MTVVTLLTLQPVLATARQRWPRVRAVLDFRPEIVAKDGALHPSASPFGPQLTEDELRSRLRQDGVFDLDALHLVIVEPAGAVSYARTAPVPEAALRGVGEQD